MLNKKNITMKELIAKENMWLTQNADTDDRIFVKKIIGVNIKESDYRDATNEEKEEYESQFRLGTI